MIFIRIRIAALELTYLVLVKKSGVNSKRKTLLLLSGASSFSFCKKYNIYHSFEAFCISV